MLEHNCSDYELIHKSETVKNMQRPVEHFYIKVLSENDMEIPVLDIKVLNDKDWTESVYLKSIKSEKQKISLVYDDYYKMKNFFPIYFFVKMDKMHCVNNILNIDPFFSSMISLKAKIFLLASLYQTDQNKFVFKLSHPDDSSYDPISLEIKIKIHSNSVLWCKNDNEKLNMYIFNKYSHNFVDELILKTLY